MNIKVNGSEPVNIELSQFKFTLHTYNNESFLHFTMTKEEAKILRDNLNVVLAPIPERIIRASYPVKREGILPKFLKPFKKNEDVKVETKQPELPFEDRSNEERDYQNYLKYNENTGTSAEEESERFWRSMN